MGQAATPEKVPLAVPSCLWLQLQLYSSNSVQSSDLYENAVDLLKNIQSRECVFLAQVSVLVIGAGPTGLGAATRINQHGLKDWLIIDQVLLRLSAVDAGGCTTSSTALHSFRCTAYSCTFPVLGHTAPFHSTAVSTGRVVLYSFICWFELCISTARSAVWSVA